MVEAGDIITFTGAGSADADLKPILVPASGLLVANECWIDDPVTDFEVSSYDGGGNTPANDGVDIFATDPVNTNVFAIQATVNGEAQAGELEGWDTGSYAAATKESLVGTTVSGDESFWRAGSTSSNVAVGAGAGSLPTGGVRAYVAHFMTDTEYTLNGSTNTISFATALTVNLQNRWIMHVVIPSDATNPTEANRTIEMTYHYFYT